MSKLRLILEFAGCALAILVGFAFSFLELRSLFAGDFSLMNNAASAFFTLLFKGLYFLGIVALAVAIIVFRIKHKDICFILFMASVGLFIGAFISIFHFEFIFAVVFMAITAILMSITTLGYFRKTNNE